MIFLNTSRTWDSPYPKSAATCIVCVTQPAMVFRILIKIKWPACMEQLFPGVAYSGVLLPKLSLQTIAIYCYGSGWSIPYPYITNDVKKLLHSLTPSGNPHVCIKSFILSRCASASSSGWHANSCLKIEQLNACTGLVFLVPLVELQVPLLSWPPLSVHTGGTTGGGCGANGGNGDLPLTNLVSYYC